MAGAVHLGNIATSRWTLGCFQQHIFCLSLTRLCWIWKTTAYVWLNFGNDWNIVWYQLPPQSVFRTCYWFQGLRLKLKFEWKWRELFSCRQIGILATQYYAVLIWSIFHSQHQNGFRDTEAKAIFEPISLKLSHRMVNEFVSKASRIMLLLPQIKRVTVSS